jgi:hypothetical protein
MGFRFYAIGLVSALVLFVSISPAPTAQKSTQSAVVPLNAEELAKRIDSALDARRTEKGVPATPLTEDTEFLRRVYLDLAGCIPSIIDARDFLDDARPNKRRIWVDLILDGKKPSRKPDAFNRHFANVYRAWILSRVNSENAVALASWWC